MTSTTITTAASGTWRLGDRTIHRIGFGAMRLTSNADGSPSDRDRAVSVLRRAVDLGVDHIDTAAFYFSSLRSANELINRALHPYPDDLVIATKVGPRKDASGEWMPPGTPKELRGQVEENLRQLGRDHLDLVNLRVWAGEPVSEHMAALAELRDAGLIRHLGISNVRPHQLAEAQSVTEVVCVQNRFGVGASEIARETLRACGEQGIAFVPFFAIAGSGREGEAPAPHPEVAAVADAHGASPAQVRLAWTLQQGPHVLAIPGTGNPAHLEANVAAGALRLTADETARLDAVTE